MGTISVGLRLEYGVDSAMQIAGAGDGLGRQAEGSAQRLIVLIEIPVARQPGGRQPDDERHVVGLGSRKGRDDASLAVADQADPARIDLSKRLEKRDGGQRVVGVIGAGGSGPIACRVAHASFV